MLNGDRRNICVTFKELNVGDVFRVAGEEQRWLLVEAAERILPGAPPSLAGYAARELERDGYAPYGVQEAAV